MYRLFLTFFSRCRWQKCSKKQLLCSCFFDCHHMWYSYVLRHDNFYCLLYHDQGNSSWQFGLHNCPHPGHPIYPTDGTALLRDGRLFRRGEPERLEDPSHHSRIRPHILNHALESTLFSLVHRRCFHHSR